jgi:Dolichyl-phosphate-mannose-protein mannosyltransferase
VAGAAGPVVRRARALLLPAATVGAIVEVVLLAHRAVFLAPLNVDEELTLRVSEFSLGHIFHIVSTERGGGPLHFWLEHVLLGWSHSLVALRVPSLVFFCLALPAVALIVRELVGTEAAAATVLLVGAAPIPESYATFGRPHAMLFAWLMWGTVAALRAAVTGSRRWWVAAGAGLGSSIFVHPTAPLYALVAFAGALLYARRQPRQLAREAWPGVLALGVTFLPYWVATLGVLGDRYGVSGGARHGRTFSGRPVWDDAVHFLAPSRHLWNWFTLLALAGFLVLVLQRRSRAALVLALTVVAPVVFFMYVPANGLAALFFDRYMIPAAPAFLALVAAGCAFVPARFALVRFLVLAGLVAWLVTIEIRVDVPRQHRLVGLRLDAITRAVAADRRGAVLFGTTGSGDPSNAAGAFTFGRPANVLDRYLSLRIGGLRVVDDDACVRVAPFAASAGPSLRGLWVFYAAFPDQEEAAAHAFAGAAGVTVARPAPQYFLIRSRKRLPPRRLLAAGLRLRRLWQSAVPANPRVSELIDADAAALGGRSCRPYGVLDDPDITPNWPIEAAAN